MIQRGGATEQGNWAELAKGILEPEMCTALSSLDLQLSPSPVTYHRSMDCYLKREDRGLFGTHKSRGLLLQILKAGQAGCPGFVISSSGNAGLAAASLSRALNHFCVIFLSHKTPYGKIEAILETGMPTVVTPKPKNLSRYASRFAGLVDLRPSKHPDGATGYGLIAAEIARQRTQMSSIFCFCNSGLTLAGLYRGYRKLMAAGHVEHIPQLHAVQCSADVSFAEYLEVDPSPQKSPIAGALGAQSPSNQEEVGHVLKMTGGTLWMVHNREIEDLDLQMQKEGDAVALESVAALVALGKARRMMNIGSAPMAVVAGRRYTPDVNAVALQRDNCFELETRAQVREFLLERGLGRWREGS